MTPTRTTLVSLALAATALAGCDLPTQAPKWNTTWILPVHDDTVAVSQFLPASVTVAGSNFVTTVARDSVRQSLGQMCGACGALNGTSAALPAFSDTLTHTDSFPGSVLAITPGGGLALSFRIDNALGFDPLRPGTGLVGKIVTTITDSAGNAVATDSVDGGSDSLPSGTSMSRSIPLGANAIHGPIHVVAAVTIPGSDAFTVDTSASLKVTTTTDSVTLAGVTVSLLNQSVQSGSVDVDWSGIDTSVQQKMQRAKIQLTTHNPFTAEGTGTITFTQGGTPVIPAKNIVIAAGDTTQLIDLSQSEIQTLTGAGQSTVSVAATVSGTGGGNAVTIMPGQQLIVQTHVLVTLTIGGN